MRSPVHNITFVNILKAFQIPCHWISTLLSVLSSFKGIIVLRVPKFLTYLLDFRLRGLSFQSILFSNEVTSQDDNICLWHKLQRKILFLLNINPL